LSYLTIEKKGEIPIELRDMGGNLIFGCDICQQVCPWNRFSPPEGDPAFSHRTETTEIDLVDELKLDPMSFNKKFKGSPVKRSKRRGYLRNISVALGNSKNELAIPQLADVMKNEPEALVRQHAAWALGQIGSPEAIEILQTSQEVEIDEDVLREIKRFIK
jgi:epoxyqueuosine reductase